MLNCCIERKKTRESTSVDQTTKIGDRLTTSTNKDFSISSEDEEFFECREEDSEKQDENVPTSNEGTTDENITLSENDSNVAGAESPPADKLDSDNKNLDKPNELDSCQLEADGRLKPFEDLKLLNVDDLMYIPVTQEPSPMTEDLLEEHAEVLAK